MRNTEVAALSTESVLENAAVSMAIETPAPMPTERKVPEKPSLFLRILAKIKSFFAEEEKAQEEKAKSSRPNRNQRQRRSQERRPSRRSRNENVDNAKADSNERNNKRNKKANIVEEQMIDETSVLNVIEEVVEVPATQRRQRRDLRKKVRVGDENQGNENLSAQEIAPSTVTAEAAVAQTIVTMQSVAIENIVPANNLNQFEFAAVENQSDRRRGKTSR